MPGPKTHDIFYKQLKEKLSDATLSSFPNYDKYNIFAQGHDFLIYYNFYKFWKKKLDNNIKLSVLLQETKFQDFIYNYLITAKNNGTIEDEQVRLFIGAGYIMHHILDAYLHPLIIYYSGDHTPNPNMYTWVHGCVENLIDIYMMEKYEKSSKYKVYKDFHLKNNIISNNLISTLNESIKKTYQLSSCGDIFKVSFYQMELFMRTMKYDYFGIKKVLFNKLDRIFHGASSFSYNRDWQVVVPFLNEQKEVWYNPYDDKIKSNASFMELYNQALEYGSQIVEKLEKICKSNIINKDDIYNLIPNISSVTGLESYENPKIIIKKHWEKNPKLF